MNSYESKLKMLNKGLISPKWVQEEWQMEDEESTQGVDDSFKIKKKKFSK